MENEHVLSALNRKRAEIAGEVGRLTEIIDGLQRDLVCVDRAICLFDPEADPDTIAPVRKRHRALSPRVFRHGVFSWGILGVRQEAKAPLTAMGISETETSVAAKVNRGAFPAWFLIATMRAIGARVLRLED